ncbi:transporter [Sphingomonas endophytica]|uniref:Transporter n=1 Tax=Sphingomonas endophytica TaxID=869719 RepID=A0A147I929_9SPHN|nr:transporter [Sphingomonas endophytica]KTT75725.1 hypothetical protein NS334_02170 [Sphingomonas endophytica]
MIRAGVSGLLLAASAPALAEEARFCPNRPSLGASGCTTLPGQVQVELSISDRAFDEDADTREEVFLHGDVTLRTGVTRRDEVQIGWTPFGTVRVRDKATGTLERTHGTGDVTLGWRHALSHPDGAAVSIAVQPYVTLPVGHSGVGAGDWAAGVVLPVSWELDEQWTLGFTGQLAAATDEDGVGRHFDGLGVFGLGYALTDALTATAELAIDRDDDPLDHATRTMAGASVAWQVGKRAQLDVLTVVGLNDDTTDVRFVVGGALLF